MSRPASPSPALPLAHATLRLLIVANWLMGAAIAVLLLAMPTQRWIIAALGFPPDAGWIVLGLHAIAVLGLLSVPLNHAMLTRLLAIVQTVRNGDPFVAANAERLQRVAWVLVALQVLSLVIGAIGKAVSTPAHPLHLDAGFSAMGWLAVLLTFLLARVFALGAAMRDDLEGTV